MSWRRAIRSSEFASISPNGAVVRRLGTKIEAEASDSIERAVSLAESLLGALGLTTCLADVRRAARRSAVSSSASSRDGGR